MRLQAPQLVPATRHDAEQAQLTGQVGVDVHLLDVDPTDPGQLAAGANRTLVTDAGWLDFMPAAEGARDYADLAVDAVPVRDGTFRVVGLDDLIRMKRAAGRAKDLDDIAALTYRERKGM